MAGPMASGAGSERRRYLELACFNVSSALVAASAGADRIEFCSGADVGGTTPLLSDLKALRDQIGSYPPINVMIRPRGGSFIYTNEELEQMKHDIIELSSVADGFVFGVLDAQDGIDMKSTRELLETVAQQAGRKPCTFHRAFDECQSPLNALQDIIQLGFHSVLTSGGGATALDGMDTLRKLVDLSRSQDVHIIIGGGVRSSNVERLVGNTGATWYHSSAVIDSTGVANAGEAVSIKIKMKA